jgi:far upstream element-binding protein
MAGVEEENEQNGEENHLNGEDEHVPNGSVAGEAINSKKRSLSEDAAAVAEDNKKFRGAGTVGGGGNSGNKDIPPLGANTMIMEIVPDKVGRIIGSKGQVIQEVQLRSGCKAYVNQDFPPTVNRQLHLTGTPEQIQMASDLIRRIITEGPTAIHLNSIHGGPPAQRVLECSQGQVGKIIGGSGATINDIQSKSGARIQIEQDFPPDVPRKIRIEGSTTAVNVAAKLVMDLLAQPPGGGGGGGGRSGGAGGGGHGQGMYQQPSPYGPPAGQYGAYSSYNPTPHVTTTEMAHIIDVPKSTVGKIIGKGGDTISMIQSKSGCKVTVDQNVPEGAPCKVSVVGTAHNIGIACQIVSEIVQGYHTSKIGVNCAQPILNNQQPYQMYGMPGMAAPAAPGPAMPVPGMPAYPMYGYPYQGYPQGMPGMPPMSMPMGGPGPGPAPGPQAAPQAAPYGYPYMAQPGQAPAQAGQYGMPMQQGYPAHAPAPQAPKPTQAPTPSLWTEHKTDDGLPYWYNASTGVSQWERPKNV